MLFLNSLLNEISNKRFVLLMDGNYFGLFLYFQQQSFFILFSPAYFFAELDHLLLYNVHLFLLFSNCFSFRFFSQMSYFKRPPCIHKHVPLLLLAVSCLCLGSSGSLGLSFSTYADWSGLPRLTRSILFFLAEWAYRYAWRDQGWFNW